MNSVPKPRFFVGNPVEVRHADYVFDGMRGKITQVKDNGVSVKNPEAGIDETRYVYEVTLDNDVVIRYINEDRLVPVS